ncbi:protein FAM78B-like isoform X2 [Watersipora subatra]|uniref:protein FAM78B-like isoform X2 n=1 Tax=Watersipora subatra TaxID=2589382 RepID=UPI00355AE451
MECYIGIVDMQSWLVRSIICLLYDRVKINIETVIVELKSNAANNSSQPLTAIQTRSSLHHHKHSSKLRTTSPSTHSSRRASGGSNRPRTERTERTERAARVERPEWLPHNLEGLVTITSLSATIDKKPTTIDERSTAVLKYRTPHFRASASVRIPQIPEKETWQVGWIQACTDMVFLNTYGPYGVSSWEFPELKTGGYMMISDSDGRNYPWYGSRTEVVTVTGPTKSEQNVTVTMNDNFYPHITWSVPLRNHRTPALTHVRRTQGFYTWLVAKSVDTNQIYILKTIRWTMHLEISVDPSQPLGHRARLLGTGIQTQPSILNYNVEIVPCALQPPNANSAQNLIWYPAMGSAPPAVIVPAKWNPDEKKEKENAEL